MPVKTTIWLALLLFLMACQQNEQNESKNENRPNIVLIMADDMGFSDLGCYGSEIETPNIDQLAVSGLRYNQFYNTGRCCPTRASLLTGLYPHQTSMGWMTAANMGEPGYTGDLNQNCVTIASVLKSAGYATYMSGKWHVAGEFFPDSLDEKHNWPLQRGFDQFFGTLDGAGSYFDPSSLTQGNMPIEPDSGFYYTDAISDHASDFISQHMQADSVKPFFMCVAYTAPHWPLHAKPQDIEKYSGKYKSGWGELRKQRYQKLLELGVVDSTAGFSERNEDVPAWESLSAKEKEDMAKRMAIYAAQIDAMDQGIGRILESLEKAGKRENTLVIFLSDNGGCAEPISRGTNPLAELGTAQSFTSYLEPWANASNTPFRLYKKWTHEGGIATPLIINWPANIRGNGAIRQQPGHVIDIMATCVEVAEAYYPTKYNDHDIYPMEGKSLVPSFSNDSIQREALYFEHEGKHAIRKGKWKLVAQGANAPWELYNLASDRSELNNLAKTHPEMVKELSGMWHQWAETHQVLPLSEQGWNERIANSLYKN